MISTTQRIPTVEIIPFYKNSLGLKHGRKALWLVKDETGRTLLTERSMTEALYQTEKNGWVLKHG